MTVTQSPGLAGSPIVELRQYTLHPGGVEVLVPMFERWFVERQEAVGMRLGGLFCDRDDPDRFVWMRGFASMDARREALSAFYGGPVWRAHASAANATMIDSDDVLLLRPTDPPHPPSAPAARAPYGAEPDGDPWVLATVWLHPPGRGTCRWLAREVQPLLASTLATRVATWCSEPAENTFPDLPVRRDHAFLWTATFADHEAYEAALGRLSRSGAWPPISEELDRRGVRAQTLRLRPTARSAHPPATPPRLRAG